MAFGEGRLSDGSVLLVPRHRCELLVQAYFVATPRFCHDPRPVERWICKKAGGCTDIFVHSHHCVGGRSIWCHLSQALVASGFIPNPGDLLEFELEKGKSGGSRASIRAEG